MLVSESGLLVSPLALHVQSVDFHLHDLSEGQIPHWLFHHKGKYRLFRYLLSSDCETFSGKASEVFGQRLESQSALGLKVQPRCFTDEGGEVGELCNVQLVHGQRRTGPPTCQ